MDQDDSLDNITQLNFLKNSCNTFSAMLVDFLIVSYYYFLLKFKNKDILIASFGFGYSYLYFSMTFLYGSQECIGIFLSKYIGQRDPHKITLVLFKIFYVFLMLCSISILLVIFSRSIMEFFNVDQQIIQYSIPYVKLNIFERILDGYVGFYRSLLICFDKTQYFNQVSVTCACVFIFFSTILSYYFEWDLNAFTVARLLKTLTEFIYMHIIIMKFYPKEGRFIPQFQKCFRNIHKVLIKVLQTSLGIYGEVMSFEICTFFVTNLHSIELVSAWVIFANFEQYCILYGISQSQYLRSKLNFAKGQINEKLLRKIEYHYTKYSFQINGVISIMVILGRNLIAKMFTTNKEIQNQVSELLFYFALYMAIFMNRPFQGSMLRSKSNKFFQVTFLTGGIFFPIGSFCLNYISIKYLKNGILSILFCFIIVDFIVFSIYFWMNFFNQQFLDDSSLYEKTIENIDELEELIYIEQLN